MFKLLFIKDIIAVITSQTNFIKIRPQNGTLAGPINVAKHTLTRRKNEELLLQLILLLDLSPIQNIEATSTVNKSIMNSILVDKSTDEEAAPSK